MKYLIYLTLILSFNSCFYSSHKKNDIEIALDKLLPGMTQLEIDKALPDYMKADWKNKVTYEPSCSSVYLIVKDTIISGNKYKYQIDFCSDTLTHLKWTYQ